MSEKVSVGEDLMREHGLINRIINVCKESALRVVEEGDSVDILRQAAQMNMDYIHNFHEEFEEHEVYTHFDDDEKLHEITEIMEEQHDTGKQMTQSILDMTKDENALDPSALCMLGDMLQQFEQMYIPHAAQEDTVLWPALQKKLGDSGYMEMGSKMGEQEDEKFGEEYFEKAVSQVEELEKRLGIDDLSAFTANASEVCAPM